MQTEKKLHQYVIIYVHAKSLRSPFLFHSRHSVWSRVSDPPERFEQQLLILQIWNNPQKVIWNELGRSKSPKILPSVQGCAPNNLLFSLTFFSKISCLYSIVSTTSHTLSNVQGCWSLDTEFFETGLLSSAPPTSRETKQTAPPRNKTKSCILLLKHLAL